MALAPALLAMDRALPSGSVVTDRDICAGYGKDESEATAVTPEAVIRVSSTSEVAAVMRAASEHGVPVTPRAGGTGRVGAAVPVPGGIVMSFEGMDQLKDIDRGNGVAVVEPGLVTGAFHRAVEAEGLFYPPDPNSWASCRLGGNIATNAGGPRAFKYGVTREYVLGLEVVTADGTTMNIGRRTRKGVAGYDLTSLVVGSEGTLAIVTAATMKLLPLPEAVMTLCVFLPDENLIGEMASLLARARITPRCIELLDAETLAILRDEAGLAAPPTAKAMILMDLDGDADAMDGQLARAGDVLTAAGALDIVVAKNEAERERLWASRREMSRSLRRVSPLKLSEDVVVPVTKLGDLLRATRELSDRTGLRLPAYGHAGDGNLHVNFLWNSPDDWPRVQHAIGDLLRTVVSLGGTITGEHGIGIMKAPYLGLEQSAELMALEMRIKETFDPKGVLNPGKIFPAAAKHFHGAC